MTEKLLQYIWQFRYFNLSNLQTTDALPITLVCQGTLNTQQGPDFLDAQLKIGNTIWAGSVEVHVNASEWKLHGHSSDENYRNVILHVVWKQDMQEPLPIPTLELYNRIPSLLLDKYAQLMQGSQFIACQNQVGCVNPMVIEAWKQRLLIERLEGKLGYINKLLKENNQHWEACTWWLLARNFGMKTNAEAFEKMARSIPLAILGRHRDNLLQLEALLFGQAGLLEKKYTDTYPQQLQKEYRFLRKKYRLDLAFFSVHFLRMRPANFPTVRLAQLAALLHRRTQFFSSIRDITTLKQLEEFFTVTPSTYWQAHYNFDDLLEYKPKRVGKQMVLHIILNTVVSVVFAYGQFTNLQAYKDRALDWMMELDPERNRITRGFQELGLSNCNAGDSQALLHLKNEYCNYRRCLDCAIGNQLLKQP